MMMDDAAPGQGSLIEEFIYSLDVMPVEVQRYTSLMRELDSECEELKVKIQALHAEFMKAATKAVDKLKTANEKEKAIQNLKKSAPFNELEIMRDALSQNIAEKISIADQLYDMSEYNLKRLDKDIALQESILIKKGQMVDFGYQAGAYVAAEIQTGGDSLEFVLATLKVFTPANSESFVVEDADDHKVYELPKDKIIVLPQDETLAAAKQRLQPRGKKVMALYPSTTTFYKSTLCTLPYLSTASNTAEFPVGSVLCGVQFDGDEVDAATGAAPKHIFLTTRVFVV